MKVKFPMMAMMAIFALLLTGCEMACQNMTPAKMPQNASGIYTMKMSTNIRDGAVAEQSVNPCIVIDGQTHPMKRDPLARNTFTYDYPIPTQQNQAAYYYVVNYKANFQGAIRDRQLISDIYTLSIVNRYIHALEMERGPVGTSVTVSGRGFNSQDQVYVGDSMAPTRFLGPTALSFRVPFSEGNRSYPVSVHSQDEVIHVGTFYVDASPIRTNLNSIQVSAGERTTLVLKIDFAAPEEGLEIQATTDIPESLVMEPIVVPAGARTVSVVIEATKPAQGTLFLEAKGFAEKQLPVIVIEPSRFQMSDLPPDALNQAPADAEASVELSDAASQDDAAQDPEAWAESAS